VLGGILGAVIGANVGKSAAACEPGQADSYQQGYAARRRRTATTLNRAATSRGPTNRAPMTRVTPTTAMTMATATATATPRPVADAPSADNCTLAESPIYLPDGRVQKRFVRVCRDAQGRYQVVD
jgi:hypothetical protein